MLSLQDIVTTPDTQKINLECWTPVPEDEGLPQTQRAFEWLNGLDYLSFPFTNEYNFVMVSSDLKSFLESEETETFFIAPTKDNLERAIRILKHNSNAKKIDQRRRYEEFGAGPWECILLPGEYVNKAKLPQLYKFENGRTIPIELDPNDINTLPRFTSTIHPVVATYYLFRRNPDRFAYSKTPDFLPPNGLIPEPQEKRNMKTRAHVFIACNQPSKRAAHEMWRHEEVEEPCDSPDINSWAVGVVLPPDGDLEGVVSAHRDCSDDDGAPQTAKQVLGRLEEENEKR
ncbi:hypothetical protein V5O48_004129 [Marasmius crinis-equi]|uniref:Uncharacterized protein n=1 Tax=Marasmius crinis-equi TaxID=585013 RepID=A0ABR3FR00_9AGAR